MPVQIDPATGERIESGGSAIQIDPATGERMASAAPSIDISNAAGRGVYAMWDDKGQKQPIPYDKVMQAQQLGYKFDTNPTPTGLTPGQQFSRDQAADPARRGGTSLLMSSGMTPEQDTARARQIEANAPLPIQIAAGISKGGATLGAPAVNAVSAYLGLDPKQVDDELAARGVAQHIAKYGTVAAGIGTALPSVVHGLVAAPLATVGGIGAGVVGGVAGNVIGPAVGLGPAGSAVLGDVLGMGAGVGGSVGGEAAQESIPAVKAAAGRYLPALIDGPPESLFTRALKPYKNNTNWLSDVKVAGPLMKSAEAELGHPVRGELEAFDDALAVNKIAKTKVWNQFKARLGPMAEQGATIDGNKIADAMMATVDERTKVQNPALAARIEATADTYRRPMTVDEAENYLRSTNAENAAYYAKSGVKQRTAMMDPETAYKVAEGDALRETLYAKMDEMTGPGSAQLKKAYGALTNFEKELQGRKLVYERQQPESLAEQLGKVKAAMKMAKGVATANVGALAEGAEGFATTRLIKERNDSGNMIKRAFENLNPASPFPQPTFRAPQTNPAFMLPAQSAAGGKYPMYAPDPGMSPGERLAALMQLLRQNPQLQLPAKVSAIPLPPPQ